MGQGGRFIQTFLASAPLDVQLKIDPVHANRDSDGRERAREYNLQAVVIGFNCEKGDTGSKPGH